MKLTKELFVIPNGNKFILYAPLKRAVAEVNEDMILLLKKVKAGKSLGDLEKKTQQLIKLGIITKGETPVERYVPKKGFKPTSLTLIPGLDCNLRCVYCYSAAGEMAGKTMSIEIAKNAIDLVIKNALRQGKKQVELEFHGGGEPFIPRNMEMIRKTVNYFRKQTKIHKLKPEVVSITNGVMALDSLKWVASNFDSLTISFDGPEDIQNRQRPGINGSPTFGTVMETIAYLESIGFKYHLRSTITRYNVSRMSEIVKFFSSISSTNDFALEPLFECGRCSTSKTESPNPEEYIKNLIKAQETATKLGKTVHYSGSVVEGVYDCFCGSIDSGLFCVLPEGEVTSCLEVCRKSDPRANIFIIGKYNVQTKRFVIYHDRIRTLRSRNVDSIPNCKDCFAKYNCAGDCPAKSYAQSGSLFDTTNNTRCEMTRGTIKNILIKKLKGGNTNNDFKI